MKAFLRRVPVSQGCACKNIYFTGPESCNVRLSTSRNNRVSDLVYEQTNMVDGSIVQSSRPKPEVWSDAIMDHNVLGNSLI